MSSLITILPKTFTYTKKKAINKFIINLMIAITVSVIAFFMWSKKPDFTALIITLTICYPFGNLIFSRFPVRIEIDKSTNNLTATYLNGLGNEKIDTIYTSSAIIRFVRVYKNFKGMQVRITQNIFNNWIYIDVSHGFTNDQIKFIYDCVS